MKHSIVVENQNELKKNWCLMLSVSKMSSESKFLQRVFFSSKKKIKAFFSKSYGKTVASLFVFQVNFGERTEYTRTASLFLGVPACC